MTVWLAALHKILFTAHAEEKLQQQSSPEAGEEEKNQLTWQHLERGQEEGQAL